MGLMAQKTLKKLYISSVSETIVTITLILLTITVLAYRGRTVFLAKE